jgi:nicotinamide-nucleotide amidase
MPSGTSGRTAAIVTVGTELTEGIRVDTNRVELAAALSGAGFDVTEAVSVGDDADVLASALARLGAACGLVVVTGGLGPTHDDITRQAASDAFGLELRPDPAMVAFLAEVISRHHHPDAAAHVRSQALALAGAEILAPTTGTAPGQILPTPAGLLALLPGPPKEMRGMLPRVLERAGTSTRAARRELGVTGMAESDAQLLAQEVLQAFGDTIRLTVLARPGDVRVVLLDRGAGDAVLQDAARRVAKRFGEACYSTSGETLPQALVREASARHLTLALAESCTGGLVASAITDVPGASEVFLGSAVTYSNTAKGALLGVADETLRAHGAVSAEAAAEMAEGALSRLGADVAVSITGIAGPGGGSAEKPVGLVWFATATTAGVETFSGKFGSDRDAIRQRATARALALALRVVRA